MRRHARLAMMAIGGVAALAVTGGTALTAGNEVTAGAFGQGVGVVSGFTVDEVSYTMNSESPDPRVLTVSFAITRSGPSNYLKVLPDNATVKIRLVSGVDTFSAPVTCLVSLAGNSADCSVSGLDARASTLTGISVLAYDTIPET